MKTERYSSHAGSAPHHQGQIYNEATGKTVAITYDDEGGEVATLFAAAPELLAALEGMLDCWECENALTNGVTGAARAVIAKALGR